MASVMESFRYRDRMRLFNRATKLREAEEATEAEDAKDATEAEDAEAVAEVLLLAATRIDGIVKAADRAAAEIRSASSERLTAKSGDSEQGGRGKIVADLAASLVERADALRAEAAKLADLLTRASGRLGVDLDGAPAADEPEWEAQPAGLDLTRRVRERFGSATNRESGGTPGSRVPFKRRASAPSRPKQEGRKPSNDGLRLLATQMAVAGSSRDEIESRLRSEFGIEDPSAITKSIQTPDARL